MRYSPILSHLLSQHLMMEENAWEAFRLRAQNIEATLLQPARSCGCDESGNPPARYERVLEIITPPQVSAISTAIITFSGAIVKHADAWECDVFGLVDLDDVDAALTQVAADESIGNLLLKFVNCPGGTVIGVPETAAKVARLTRTKNVKTFSDSQWTSAAAFIGTQASEVFVTASTYSGSIGSIRAPILDFSKNLAMNGITPHIIKSGKFKDTGTQLRPPSEEELAMLQALSDRTMKLFTTAVKSSRPRMTAESMQGQLFFGAQAIEVGLADAVVEDLAAALAQF